MKNSPLFYYILAVAQENGYIVPDYIQAICDSSHCEIFDFKDLILYSKKFAKAFFGQQDTVYSKSAWVHRLQEMSKEANEIKYLEKFL